MSRIAQVSEAMRRILTIQAKQLERETGFVQRRRQNATSSQEGPAKGVQRPNARKRRPGEKRPRQRKKRKTSPRRLQLLGWTILITNVPACRLSVQEALVLADRTVLEVVETGGPHRYLAQRQAAAHLERDRRQVAGLSHHPLGDARRVLAGSQSQPEQSAPGHAVDGESRTLGGDRRAHRPCHGQRLYRQRSSESASRLSFARSTSTQQFLG